MDPISNADRLVRQLREKLEKRAKTRGADRSDGVGTVRRRESNAAREITSKLAGAGVGDQDLQRSLIEQLLVDQFGPELVNEPKFQQVVDRVMTMMADDPNISALLSRSVEGLKRRGL